MACITTKRNRLVIDFYDQHGRRRLKTLPKGTTKGEARRVLREIETQIERGTFLSVRHTPLFPEIAKDWLLYKRPNVRESTIIQYDGHIRNHLVPYFKTTKINRINFDSVEKYIAYGIEKGISKVTLKKILVTLGGIMRYSARKKLIDFNPLTLVDKPKNTKTTDRISYLRPNEIRRLIDNTDGQKYMTLFKLAVMTGMRQGELLGAKWTDINWQDKQIYVSRSFNNGRFHDPKTHSSRRAIDIPPSMVEDLKKWQLTCMISNQDLIFPNEAGKPMNHQNMVTRHFNPSLRRAGLPIIRFHDLRHTYAALLIEQGEHPKYIQSQMGHSSIKITMDTYGHLMKSINREASIKLDKTVFGEDGDILET